MHGDPDRLLRRLVGARLCGRVQTPAASSLHNCGRLVDGDPVYTFGLSDWRDATFAEAVAAVRALGGTELEPDGEPVEGDGFIEPSGTLAGIEAHRRVLADHLQQGGSRVLLATGHPFALLAHYGALARALSAAGCQILRPLEDRHGLVSPGGVPCSIRYLDGVGALFYDGGLQHTHRAEYMERMLEAAGAAEAVELVVADHGFAGAAIEAGIPTLSIADVNDPALPLAQARGRTDSVLLIDDGLAASLFTPVTEAMLSRTALAQV